MPTYEASRFKAAALAKAVTAIESPFKTVFPAGQDVLREPELDPWKNPALVALTDRYEQLIGLERTIGMGIMRLREAESEAKHAQRLTQKQMENVRDDIVSMLEALGIQPPPRYHERTCPCLDCSPLPDEPEKEHEEHDALDSWEVK